MVTMVATKISQSYFRCVKLFIHKISCSYYLYRRKYLSLVIVELCIYHFWRHTIYCSSVFAKLLKFRFFCRFFLVKLSKSQSLKLHISRTAWPILMILVSFCRILNGLSNEISLFWRCSSPLRIMYLSGFICTFLHYVCTGSDMFRSVCDQIDYGMDLLFYRGPVRNVSVWDHLHKWTPLVPDSRSNPYRIHQVSCKHKAYPYQFCTDSKQIQFPVNIALDSVDFFTS